ncbi:MAG: single-stranded-DNA-specific exonuclease RecJ, partial [Verrucomicrobiota bacterium]
RLPPLVAQLLHDRGHTNPADIDNFLAPRLQNLSDPFLLPDITPAVDRILTAIDENQTIVAYGDYDVDGVTSLTLLSKIIGAYGHENFHTFLPHRMEEGYGLSIEGLERCLQITHPDLLIAVDCGTSSVNEVAWLKERNIDTIILDHHELSAPHPPDCVALVNPKMGDDFHYLCSAGVVFKIAHALLKTRNLENFKLRDHLDLVAVGTVADIVPLIDENRLLVRHGLQRLDQTQNHGLAALKSIAGVGARSQASDVGFRIGPRLNAAGRLDTAQDALDILLAADPLAARAIAQTLHTRNDDRRNVEARIVREITADLATLPKDDKAVVLGSRDWHPGVVGIVASRIARKHHLPTFVIAVDENGIGKGSGRSIPGVSLVAALDACRDLLIKGGGHEMAAGLTIKEQNIDPFRERFTQYITDTASEETLQSKTLVDVEANFEDLDLSLLESYEQLHPFGTDNPQPVLLCRGVQLLEEPRVLKEKHLKFNLSQNGTRREVLYFGGADEELPRPPWDIAVTIDRNEFRGRTSLSIFLQSLRPAEPS